MRNLWYYLFYSLCIVSSFISCDDEIRYDGPPPSEIDARYSNKSTTPSGSPVLTLTYSDVELYGKDIYFQLSGAHTATIVFFSIFPGEKETTVSDVQLTATGTKYTFAGSGTSADGTLFHFSGQVEKGKMIMNLTDIKIAENDLTGTWNLSAYESGKTSPFYSYMRPNNIILSSMLQMAGGTYLAAGLKSITFGKDGNITALYTSVADVVPPGGTVPPRPDDCWKQSPLNLATYYVKDDSLLYVTPNVDMIIRQVQKNKARSSGEINLEEITVLYEQLTKWCTSGICLVIRSGIGVKSNEITLVLKKDEWKSLFPFLPLLKDIIPEDIMNGPYGSFIDGFLDFFIKTLNAPESVVEFGICIDNHIELPDQE